MRSNLIEFCSRRYRSFPAFSGPDSDNASAWMFRNAARWHSGQSGSVTACNDDAPWRPAIGAPVAADSDLVFSTAIADALSQAHKIEILGHMAGGLAHRFNNLLQGVMSALNLMQSRIQPQNRVELDFLIGHAFLSVKGVGTLSQHLLEFAKPRHPEARAIDANASIVQMQDLLRCALVPGVELRVELGNGPMETICDSRLLENTLLDLVVNAREAMPAGGVLTVKTEHADLAVEYAGLPPGRYHSICVSDTGVGMSREALRRAFEPFYTTKTTGHRIGLGLPLAELFVERFQGHIGIESAVDQGTKVWLHLPYRPV